MENTENIIVSVIVPYFQREKGILTQCIQSALDQTHLIGIRLEILIIDDASPLSAEDELPKSIKSLDTIKIIKQDNKGPAGARNTGLNAVSSQIKYIAFLDSDDCWEPFHISNAIKALEAGNDFYFSDFYQLDQSITAFNRAKRINIDEHPLLFTNIEYLHQYVGNMQEQIITGNIIGTSTVVYRYVHNPKLRFREDLINAGEDYLFWLEFNTNNTHIGFSSLPECVYGKGVNIYSGTKYGTSEYLNLIYYETKYRKTILKEIKTNTITRETIERKIKEQALNFLRSILNSIQNRRASDLSILFKYIWLYPEFLLYLPINFLALLKEKMER